MKMKSENEDQCLELRSEPEDYTTQDFHKTSKISYSREVLISFAEVDTCKKLPTGFDGSILRELDAQSTIALHSYRDSDSSRFESSPSHSSWRNSERGLLGSGAIARVHTDLAETFVPVVQGSGLRLLNRSNEPYRPPHLCKEKYYSGRESKDHYNGETFGFLDNLGQDRADEEKMRRDSFELMRKNQEMVTREKQKNICDDHAEYFNPYIATVLEYSESNFESKGYEPCDVKGHSENPLVFFSDLSCQLAVGEASHIVIWNSHDKETADDQKVIEYDTTKSCFGTTESDHNLMKSAPIPVTEETPVESYNHCNAGVTSCESLEKPILSEINAHHSTQHHSLNGRNNYDVEDSKSSCSYYDEEPQNFHSLLQKEAGLTDLAGSSKLNTRPLGISYVSENEVDNNQLNKSDRVCTNKFKKNLHGPISRTLTRDSQSTLRGTGEDLASRFTLDVLVKSRIPLAVDNNYFIPLTANEYGSIEDIERIAFSSSLKQTGTSKRNSDLLVSNLHGGPDSKSSLSSFDELEICLPDEDSLITIDDYRLPQDSLFVAAGGTSSAVVNTLGTLTDCRVATSDNRFDLPGFRSPAFFHSFRDLTSSETYFNSLHMQQQSNPQLHYSQQKPATERVSHSKSQESQKCSTINPRDIKSYGYNLPSVQRFPINVHRTPSRHLQAAATGFDHFGNHHLLQGLPVPGYFPSQQMYGLPRIAFPQHTSDEMACQGQNQNATFNSSLNFNRQFLSYLENAGSRGNTNQGKLYRPSGMEKENKTASSSFFGWPSAESVFNGNMTDKR